jgi:hypothetical protein
MARRVLVVGQRGLITAGSDADAVEHEHQHKQADAIPEAIGDHDASALRTR